MLLPKKSPYASSFKIVLLYERLSFSQPFGIEGHTVFLVLDAVIKYWMRSDLQSQSQVYDSFQTEIVNVYLRNVRKEARLISVQSPAKASDLTIIASTRFNIPEERVILFYSGFRVDNHAGPISLTDRGIIHILDKRNLAAPKITVHFKAIGWSVPSFRLSLSPDATIKEIMQSYLVPQFNIEENRFFIVYAGKTLNTSNSLRQEYVEDQAQLILIQHRPAKEAFQKQAFQYNSSRHLKEKQQSSLEINCPVTYLTSVDALKKKNQQQAAFLNMQNASQIAPALASAGPKPFPLPSFPILNDSFLNAPFNINISTIQGENAEAVDEPVAPSQKSKKASKKSSQIERCAPFPEEKSGQPKIKVTKNGSQLLAPEEKKAKDKIILHLESTQQAKPKDPPSPFPFAHLIDKAPQGPSSAKPAAE